MACGYLLRWGREVEGTWSFNHSDMPEQFRSGLPRPESDVYIHTALRCGQLPISLRILGVDPTGFEPATFRVFKTRALPLSYGPKGAQEEF